MCKTKEAPTGDAHIRFVNAVVGSPSQDVYINNVLVSSGKIPYGAYTSYITYQAGISQIVFVDGITHISQASEDYGSDIGDYATFYFYGNMQGGLSAGGIKDNMTPPATGKARVRFINLDYNLTNAMVMTVVGGSNLFTSLQFSTASTYYEVDPGTKFQASATGVTTSPVMDFNLQAGKIYTIWLSGASATEIYGNAILQN
ncbi:DUF4397 domain-containing protein [Mucilaginibacter sp. S1162]|uniref:DUF4397 domain-containing protein n=1 Tax=Mucilaginibacter humi TaxID=2732510 RepID=A0ABX1W0S6_9SPHI|nr:DUF4397 domain-containing protein [Mucilaginibacter humi]NNU33533.1 DUF4397 domain-containing protein [Mucilaginibacter humi]